MAFNFSGGERVRGIGGSQQQVSSGNRIAVHLNRGQMAPPKHSTTSAAAELAMQFVAQKQKQLQAEKDQREILQGMSMAAQGQAIDEIAKSDSWMNKIFGKTNLVDGARAYYSANAGNQILQDIQDHMPDLARMDPDEARAKVQERIAYGARTGDPMLDFQVGQQVLAKMPGILKQQAKLNYEYKQTAIRDQQRNAFASSIDVAAQSLHLSASDPNTNPQDIAANIQSVREALMPVEGQDREAWEDNITEMILAQAQLAGRPRRIVGRDGQMTEVPGNLYGLEVIRASGVLDVLPPDKLDNVLRAMDGAENAMRKHAAERYSDRMANLQAMVRQPQVGQTGRDIAKYIDQLNHDYQRDTGSQSPLLNSEQRASYIGRSLDAITRANEREMDRRERIKLEQMKHAMRKKEIGLAQRLAEEAKAAKEAAQSEFVSLNRGQIGRFIARDPALGKIVQRQMNEDIDKAPDMATRLTKLASWDVIHKGTQHDVQAAVKALQADPQFAASNPDAVQEQAQRFEAMRQTMGAAKTAEYFGDQYKVMDQYMRNLRDTGSPGAAWQAANSQLRYRYGKNDDAAKAAKEIVKSEKANWLMEKIGLTSSPISNDISGTAEANLVSALGRVYEEAFDQTGSEEVATERARKALYDPAGPIMSFGNMVVETPPGQVRMDAWLSSERARGDGRVSIPSGELRNAVEGAVARRMTGGEGAKGALDQTVNWLFSNSASNTRVTQVQLDGKPAFVITAMPQDGNKDEVTFYLTADEIMDDYDRHSRKQPSKPRKPSAPYDHNSRASRGSIQ